MSESSADINTGLLTGVDTFSFSFFLSVMGDFTAFSNDLAHLPPIIFFLN